MGGEVQKIDKKNFEIPEKAIIPAGAKILYNDFGRSSYSGPVKGYGGHYIFKVFALRCSADDIPNYAAYVKFRRIMENPGGDVLDKTELVVRY